MDKKFTLYNTTTPEDPTNPEGIHEYYLNIISSMPNNVYWLDRNCITQGCNNNVLQLLNLRRTEQFIGLTYEEMGKLAQWTEGQAQSFKHDDMEVIATGKPKSNVEEPPLYDQDGNPVYYLSTRVPLFDKNKNVIGVIGISADITERKHMEEQLRIAKDQTEALSKAKSEFIANMSHDVKTPLSGIIGLAEILENELNGKPHPFIQDILISAQQLMNFFNNCLEMAKSDQIDMVLTKERFNLKGLIDEIMELFSSAIQSKNLNFHIYYDPKIPQTLLGSRGAIYRIILNLIGNAIKFTHRGSISIHATLGKKSTSKKAIIKLVIEDTGIGIPHAEQRLIFEKFTRLTPSYQGIYEGSGIGLFVVDKLVKSLQGEIYIQSEEGEGSQFIVVLPLEVSLLDESEYGENHLDTISREASKPKQILHHEIEAPDSLETTKKTLSVKHILLVEDNLIAQQIGKTLLSALNCKVDVSETGNKAVQIFEPGKYDLVFMDVGLPDISGDIVAKHLRAKEKDSNYHVPIIALTAHPVKNTLANCKEADMQGVLNKPLSSTQALQMINYYIHGQSYIVHGLEAFHEFSSKKTTKNQVLTEDLPDTESQLFQLEVYPLLDNEKGVRAAGSPTLLKEMLEILIKEILPEEIANLKEAYTVKNWDQIASIAHKLKGGCLYCGATRMLYACQYLERYHKSGQNKLLNKLYNQCINVLEQTKKHLEH